MTLTTEQLAALKEVAEKAQATAAGPWGYDLNGYVARVLPDDEEWGPTVAKLVGTPFHHTEGEHIAAFDPTTCLALLEEVERLTAVNIKELLNEIKARLLPEQAEQFERLLMSATRDWVDEVTSPAKPIRRNARGRRYKN